MVVRAQDELREGPDALVAADVPPSLESIILEVVAEHDVRIRVATARTKPLGGNRRNGQPACEQPGRAQAGGETVSKQSGRP
jgi:hypothetical protein